MLVVIAAVTVASCRKQADDKEANATEPESATETEETSKALETTVAADCETSPLEETVAAVKHAPVKKFDSVYTIESADSDEEPSIVTNKPTEETSLIENDTPVTTQSKITKPS